MKITIVKFEKAVAVQFVGMIEDLRGVGQIFDHEGFRLDSFVEAGLQWEALCFPGENKSSDDAVERLRFGSNEERDEWVAKCTNCLKAWKESRQKQEAALPDRWTMEVD